MIKEYIVKKSIGNHSGRVFSQKEVGELVRCKDCEHCEKRRTANYIPFFYCLMQECSVKDNDYCSYGERKEQEYE